MPNDRKIVAAIGLTERKKFDLVRQYKRKGFIIAEFEEVIFNLLEPGREGHRQVVNYFGEDFMLKSGKINLKKLWKFTGSDEHKNRIFHLMMEPVFLNYLQELSDKEPEKSVFVLLPRLLNKKNLSRFSSVIS